MKLAILKIIICIIAIVFVACVECKECTKTDGELTITQKICSDDLNDAERDSSWQCD